MLTLLGAAKRLNVSEKTVRRLVANQSLPRFASALSYGSTPINWRPGLPSPRATGIPNERRDFSQDVTSPASRGGRAHPPGHPRAACGERWPEVVDDLPLSEPSTTWLVRMRQALVDLDVTQAGFNELADVFAGYRVTLSLEEASELNRRVQEFDTTKQAICEILDGDP